MLILNVLYELPDSVCPGNPHAEVHEFTIEFGYDPSQPVHYAYQADVTHDARIVCFGEPDGARQWMKKKHFTKLTSYHTATALEGEPPFPSQYATECWVYQPSDGEPSPRT